MDETQVKQSLEKLFEHSRIVIWYDDDASYADNIPVIDGITVLNLDEMSVLKARVIFDINQPEQKFLLYSANPQPSDQENWLLDVTLYAPVFKADMVSSVMRDLNLVQHHWYQFFADKKAFFKNKDRRQRFQDKRPADTDSDEMMAVKMMAATLKLDTEDAFRIVIAILSEIAKDGSLDSTDTSLQDFQKFGLEKAFWKMVSDKFGYNNPNPTLHNFILSLFASDLAHSLGNNSKPVQISNLIMSKAANAAICLNNWRDTTSGAKNYDALSKIVAKELMISEWGIGKDVKPWLGVCTFREIDVAILNGMMRSVVDQEYLLNNAELYGDINARQKTYWVSGDKKLELAYDAIKYASDLLALVNKYQPSVDNIVNFEELYKFYVSDLYRIDQSYRKTIDSMIQVGMNKFEDLYELVENFYTTGFIDRLGRKLNDVVESALINWKVPGIIKQCDFYKAKVSSDEKTVVIISDALRYEVAQELSEELNKINRIKSEIQSMLGVVPSHTTLGMAALLPHDDKLAYNDKNQITVDGKSTIGTDARTAILSKSDGIAIRLEDLRKMDRNSGREFVKDHQLIYVYHGGIDEKSHGGSEEETCKSVHETIIELTDMVNYLIGTLNVSKVYITADHGFLFQYSQRKITDKNSAETKFSDPNTVTKKRYAYGKDNVKLENSLFGSTAATAKTLPDQSVYFNVPCGAGLYNFVGGARFTHGGVMPQEIVVPLVAARIYRDPKSVTTSSPVKVTIVNAPTKLTNSICKFKLLQAEMVDNRHTAVTLKFGLYDQNNKAISNIETITFDAKDKENREKEIKLNLINQHYNSNQFYCLRLSDENGTIIENKQLKIDLVYDNEF